MRQTLPAISFRHNNHRHIIYIIIKPITVTKYIITNFGATLTMQLMKGIISLVYLKATLICVLALSNLITAKTSLYDFKINDISGQPVNLADYKGKVLLIFNTASQCGFTDSHLKALNRLHKIMLSERKPFEILAFPCNDFDQQEPGTEEEIEMFLRSKYQCEFPIMEKVSIVGEATYPLWKYIIETSAVPPTWNFQKYLYDANGKFVTSWDARTSVQSIFENIKDVVDRSGVRNEL